MKISIIKFHMPILLLILTVIFAITILVFFYCLIALNMLPHESNFLKYLGIIWFSSGVVFFILKFHVNFYKKIGYIKILPDDILILLDNREFKIIKEDIIYISIKYNGYKGKHRTGRGLLEHDGSGNLLEIKNITGSFKHQFLLSNKLSLKKIKTTLLNHNYKFKIIKRTSNKLIFSNID